jgi:hypothetical protein
VYVADVSHPGGTITQSDIPPFGDLLEGLKGADLDLLLQSPGGDIDIAEKIVYMCRGRAKSLRVIVPERAKSAATLIGLASDSIVMGDTSELGPIDPQITVTTPGGKDMVRPASSFLDGLDEIMRRVQEEGTLSPVYFPLLQHLDPALIDYCHKAIERSERFAEKWLGRHMCKGDLEKAKKIAKELSDTKKYLSHAVVIDAKEAKKMGLNIESLGPENNLWQSIWRLYCFYEVDMRNAGLVKIYESSTVSISVSG